MGFFNTKHWKTLVVRQLYIKYSMYILNILLNILKYSMHMVYIALYLQMYNIVQHGLGFYQHKYSDHTKYV